MTKISRISVINTKVTNTKRDGCIKWEIETTLMIVPEEGYHLEFVEVKSYDATQTKALLCNLNAVSRTTNEIYNGEKEIEFRKVA